MKLAALFSGGKDSTYSIYEAKLAKHEIKCLITAFPLSDESMLLHYPNIQFTKLQSESMKIPQFFVKCDSNNIVNEAQVLENMLQQAKKQYGIEGIVHGGILSEFQKKYFTQICSNLNLNIISPLWHKNQKEYMENLIKTSFRFIIINVTSAGLDESWLGKELTKTDLDKLENLSAKYGFNLNFEGGEAETLVLDCPLFSNPIKIQKSKTIWDGYRGRFEIVEAKLDYNARQS